MGKIKLTNRTNLTKILSGTGTGDIAPGNSVELDDADPGIPFYRRLLEDTIPEAAKKEKPAGDGKSGDKTGDGKTPDQTG